MVNENYNYVTCSLCHSPNSQFLCKFNYRQFGLKEPFVLIKCTGCGHIYNNPRLKTEEANKLYNQDYYVINERCREKRMWLPALEDYINKVKPLEGIIDGRNLLDIGCGMGFLMKICRDNGWEVFGVDLSLTAIKYAKENLGLNTELGRIEDIDFKSRKFNLILALDLLEHLDDPPKFIERCYEILEDDGMLIIETPNIASIYRKITGKYWVGFNPYHIQFFSSRTLRRLILTSKFKILDIYTTFNDIFAKRNLWRWFSNQVFLKLIFSKIWQFKRKMGENNIYADIIQVDTAYSKLETTMNMHKLKEARNNILAKKLLGDQLVAILIKE